MIGTDLSDFSDFVDVPDNSDRPHFTKDLLKKKLGKAAHTAPAKKSPPKDQTQTCQEDKKSANVLFTTPLKLEIPPQTNDLSSRSGQPTTPSPSQGGGADETYSCVSNSSRESGISSAFSSELDTPSKREHLATIVDTETNSNPGSGASATASPSLLRAAVKANFTPTPSKTCGDESVQPDLNSPANKMTTDSGSGDAGGSRDADENFDSNKDSANQMGYAARYANSERKRFGGRRENIYSGRRVPRSLPLRMGTRPHVMMPLIRDRDRNPYDDSDFPPMDSSQECFYQPVDAEFLQGQFYSGYADGGCDFSPQTNGHHEVFVHVNPGETLSVRVGNDIQHIPGPATVRMVSHNPGPPTPLPLHVPPGHVVQQIVDETGALKHLILSPQHPHIAGTLVQPSVRGAYGYSSPEAFSNGDGPFALSRCGPVLGSSPIFDPTSTQHSRTPSEASANLGRNGPINTASGRRNLSSEESDSHDDSKRKSMSNGGRSSKALKAVNNNGNESSCIATEDDNGSDVELTEPRNVENEEQSKLIELLSKIAPPIVTEIGSREALIQWQRIDCSEASCGPFPEIEASDFSYEVFLSDQSVDGKYKQMFRGCATEYRLSELKPATDYYIKLRAVIEPWRGNQSEAIQFRTAPSKPDKPAPLKFWNRTKTSITLKWNAAVDNGSRVVSYHLESAQQTNPGEKITDSQFAEVYSGLEKQYRLTKLSAGSTYKFRLAATNDLGKSDYSDVLTVSTSGNAPTAPDPPQLTEADTFSLHLAWQKRPGDEEFVLQMDDSATNYGFIPVCNGRELTWICSELRHSQNYHFRLRAINEDGDSPWSEVVTYRTKPDKPSPPGKPYPKGRIHTTSVKLAWDAPNDNGGSEITSYSVEYMTPSVSENWALLLCGQEREHNVTGLCPGRTYDFRVSCRSDGGQSAYSEILSITTLPVAPGPCQAPVLTSKPKSNSVHLKWAAPEQVGGAEISQYEISMAQLDGPIQNLSSGERLDCAVAGLLPGRVYTFRIRAHNKAGAGSWSEPLECCTAAGPPDPPRHVKCITKSPSSVVITWTDPQNNGAPITEIRIQQAHRRASARKASAVEIENESGAQPNTAGFIEDSQGSVSSAASSANSSPVHRPRRSSGNQNGIKSVMESMATDGDSSFYEYSQIFAGPLGSCQYEVKSLKSATEYAFRLQAVNSAGISKFSSVGVCVTPPGAPSSVANFQAEGVSTSCIVASWEEAESNGSPVTSYKLEIYELPENNIIGSLDVEPDVFSHSFTDLKCETTYRIRILAQNAVGDGPWSSGLRVFTFSPPPNPPILECVSAGYNSLKLRWTDSIVTQEALAYSLEMENKNGSFSPTYEGPGHLHKVSRLNECWTYRFRIRATSPTGGIGVWSETYSFTTGRTPPPPIKAPPKVYPAGESSWQVEIQPVKVALPTNEKLHYVVQFNSSKQSPDDFKTVYTGPSNTYTLSGLEGNATYRVRACLARLSPCGEGTTETLGPISGVTSFTSAPYPNPPIQTISQGLEESDSKFSFISLIHYVYSALRGDIEMTESHYAIFFVVIFSVFALGVAFVVQWAMDSS